MVFYYNDLGRELPAKVSEILVLLILGAVIITPILIYFKRCDIALYTALFVAVIQVIATILNIRSKPM
jgi:uncharacterized protein (DUF983 family)